MTGFKLRPVGFFDRNPELDVPPTVSAHGCCATGSAATGTDAEPSSGSG